MRHFFQMDLSSLPQKTFLRSIELLGTRVKPLVDAQLGALEPLDRAAGPSGYVTHGAKQASLAGSV